MKFGDKVKKEEQEENGDNVGGIQFNVNEPKVKEEITVTDGARGSASVKDTASLRNDDVHGSYGYALCMITQDDVHGRSR